MVGMRILVTDDSKPMRMLITKTLKDLGYSNITEATSGAHALEVIAVHKFDLVFLDWNMPGMTGVEVLKALRAKPETQELPVCMVTSEAEKALVLEVLQQGVQGYLIKPLQKDMLEQKLAEIASKFNLQLPRKSSQVKSLIQGLSSAGETAGAAPVT